MTTIILDIETKTNPAIVGWDWTSRHGVGCAVTFDVESEIYTFYDQSQVNDLRDSLNHASRIVTYNGWSFDLPVVYGIDRNEWENSGPGNHLRAVSFDLLGMIKARTEPYQKGWRLGEVSLRTIGEGKSGNGSDAPELHASGQWGKLITYCWRDVNLLAKLYEFVQKHGYVIGPDGKKLVLGGGK